MSGATDNENDKQFDGLKQALATKPPVVCPKCGEPFAINLIAKAAAESRMVFALTPANGEKMDLKTVAGTLDALNKLLRAIGKDLGTKVTVLVESLESNEEGRLQVNLLITRTGT